VVKVAAAEEGTVGRSVGPQCPDHIFFLFYKIFFTESHIGLSVKITVRRNGSSRRRVLRRYSVRREAFTESKLSVKASVRGKGPSPRGIPLSAKTSNPVVAP
jgi:hypothetical protein